MTKTKKYNKSRVFKNAWQILRSTNNQAISWSECLKQAWNIEKNGSKVIDINFIYNKYYNKILSFVKFRINDPERAIEITQDVFIKANEHLASYDVNIAAVNTWLYTIAKNKVIDHYRSDKSHLKTNVSDYTDDQGNETYQFVDHNESSDHILENKELLSKINDSFNQLKGNYKKVAMLALIDQKSYAEIAEICDLSLSNVKVTLMRAKEKLQGMLRTEKELSI